MGCSTTNIHFDYEENYSKTGVDCEWAPRDGRLYAISSWTSSMVEITYSALVNRISMKMAIDPCTDTCFIRLLRAFFTSGIFDFVNFWV
ncbi:hypothetical protein Bca4012_026943 [Brassica carinata]